MQNSAAFATSDVPVWATLALVATAVVYVRGWVEIRRTRPRLFPGWRLVCFLGGLLILWLAIASPLDSLSGLLLVVHMTQHLLLMSVAPPLVALGAPVVPLLRGLPRFWVREGLGPFFTLAPVRGLERLAKSRLFAWVAMNLSFVAWHVPAAYDLALAHPGLHEVEHACFFLTSLLFWWPIVAPWPVVYRGSRWLLLPYLMSADIVNTALSAFLSFSGRIIYPSYAAAPRVFGLSALSDQVAAGSLMWVLGSTAYLGPIMWITVRQLSRRGERWEAARALAAAGIAAQKPVWIKVAGAAGGERTRRLDVLAMPGVGAFLKSRYGRQTLQGVLLLVATAVIVDGFFGHPMGSMNLAGIVPWTYARALFVLGLLLVGNLFCMSCPFMLPRELAKKIALAAGFARLPWPRWLRGKWLSAGLLGLFFWAYEAFRLWDAPAKTASLLVAYFLTAITVDSIFRGASFCKYVCPVGQFNFVSSLVSPVGLEARSQATCSSCSTRDCIAGTHDGAGVVTQRGCELDLFMPRKAGSLDCTLCMDCVKACPHDNIGLYVLPPVRELAQLRTADPQRSSVGRLSRRTDVAAVALVMVAASFASAAVMVAPVATLLDRAAGALPGWRGLAAGLGLAVAAPGVLLGLLALVVWVRSAASAGPGGGRASGTRGRRGAGDLSQRAELCRWTLALLPLGLGMWAAHLVFHVGTGWNSIVPAMGQAALDLHLATPDLHLATPDLHLATLGAWLPGWGSERSLLSADALLQVQMLLLDAGLLLALYVGWRMVRAGEVGGFPGGSRAMAGGLASRQTVAQTAGRLAPWATLVLLLYAAGVWVLLEPMQMRGMMGM